MTHVPRPLFTRLSLAEDLLRGGYTIVTANRRLSRSVLDALALARAEAGAMAWLTPAVMPRQQWILRCWDRAVQAGALAPASVLSQTEERRLWQQVIEEDAQFSMLSPSRAAAQAMRARAQIIQWRVDMSRSAVQQSFVLGEDTRHFLRWLTEFDTRLQDAGLITLDDAAASLLAAPDTLAQEKICLLEGEPPTPLMRAVLDGVADWSAREVGSATAASGAALAFPDERAELSHIARWCRQQYEADPEGRYAVVLQDMGAPREVLERLLRREFDCLTRRYESLPVNFATGLTLDRVPVVRDALRILSLGNRRVQVADFLALMTSRFLPPPGVDPERMATALEGLRALSQPELPAAVLRQALAGLTEEWDAPWDQLTAAQAQQRWHRRSRPPSQWLPVFRLQLDTWQWPLGRPLDSLEHQQLEHLLSALESLARFDGVLGDITYGAALALLREQLGDTLFQPRTGDAAIQVLGPLETTGLSFDAIWLAGMNAEHWPEAARPQPFLPRALQRELRMPHCDAQWEREQAQTRLQSWRRSASVLRASYQAQIDEAPASLSPLLSDLEQAPGSGEELDPRWSGQRDALALEGVTLTALPLTAAEAAVPANTKLLEQQAQCPFQAFASRRLQAQPPGRTVPGLTAAERGIMLHHALHTLFGEVRDSDALQRLSEVAGVALAQAAAVSARSAVSALRRSALGSTALTLEMRRLASLLLQWLAVERDREEPFTVVEREEAYQIELADLTLNVRVDRIDMTADGKRLIIDYKSGAKETPARWFDDPPSRPQLPIYALLEPEASGVTFASLKPGELGFHGVGERAFCDGVRDNIAAVSGDEGLRDMQAARGFWLRGLENLAQRFIDGDVEVAPLSDESCRRCGRHALCRIGELLEVQ